MGWLPRPPSTSKVALCGAADHHAWAENRERCDIAIYYVYVCQKTLKKNMREDGAIKSISQ